MVDVLVTLYEPTSQSSVGSVNDIYNANLTCKKQTEPPANVGILWYKNAYIYIYRHLPRQLLFSPACHVDAAAKGMTDISVLTSSKTFKPKGLHQFIQFQHFPRANKKYGVWKWGTRYTDTINSWLFSSRKWRFHRWSCSPNMLKRTQMLAFGPLIFIDYTIILSYPIVVGFSSKSHMLGKVLAHLFCLLR